MLVMAAVSVRAHAVLARVRGRSSVVILGTVVVKRRHVRVGGCTRGCGGVGGGDVTM